MNFDRTLEPQMIKALNLEYKKKGGWWQALADDEETLIAIRDKYLNVYRNGCSIARVDHTRGKLVAKVNYKFLLKKKLPKPYADCQVTCTEGKPHIEKPADFFISSLDEIDHIKSSTNTYGSVEKSGVHKIIRANQNIVDTEVALSDNDASRIDFCAIWKENDKLLLRFFEAKDYSYKGALRAKNGDAKVIDQLNKYSKTLERYQVKICNAYKESIRVAGELNGINILGKKWADVNLDNLEIDMKPRLVVFGFDADQEKGHHFNKHMDKLKATLNKNNDSRLLLKGNAKDFAVGISKK